jgi:hypothetical protein
VISFTLDTRRTVGGDDRGDSTCIMTIDRSSDESSDARRGAAQSINQSVD